jgi:hypothetical protein
LWKRGERLPDAPPPGKSGEILRVPGGREEPEDPDEEEGRRAHRRQATLAGPAETSEWVASDAYRLRRSRRIPAAELKFDSSNISSSIMEEFWRNDGDPQR